MKNWFKTFLILFVLGLLVYFNSLNNKFLMDDYRFIQNPVWSSTKFIFIQWNPYGDQVLGNTDQFERNSYYRPMAHMVLDLCYCSFKNNFWQYHLFNLILFVFASSLIYLLIGKISGNDNLALLTSVFYLVHPINGIVVNYISASVFALQVIFMLGTILLLWESLERGNDRWFYGASLLFSFLSLFWNESGVMTPLYVSAVVLLFRRGSFKIKTIYLFPYFVIVFFYFLFRAFFMSINESILKQITLLHMTGWEYPANLFHVFMWYISRLFYPRGIVMAWAMPVLHGRLFWDDVGAGALLLFLILLLVSFTKEKICQLGVAWVLVGFAPVCVAVFRRPDVGVLFEPHWLVFSSIGIFILFAYFFINFLDRQKRVGWGLLLGLIFTWGTVSHAYNQLWVDQKTYARYWSQEVPNLKVTYFYLAAALQRDKGFEESRKYYSLALNGYSSDLDIYYNLGVMDQQEGNWKNAELNYKKALSIDQYSAGIYGHLGALYLKQGQWEKAKKTLLQALTYNPLLAEPRVALAYIYFQDSQYSQAIKLCLRNLEIAPDDTNTLFLLVDIYIHQNDLVSLKKYAYRIINDEVDPQALMKLGIVMARHNITDVALDCYIKILQVAPDYKDTYFEAGQLLWKMGEYGEAVHIWRLGLKLDPSDQRFKSSIAKAVKL